MANPLFLNSSGSLTVGQLLALALHYEAWRRDPNTTLKSTSKRLGRPAQTLTTTWDALERHYAVPLFERSGPHRTGRLTPHGRLAGLHAINLAASDYLARNLAGVAELGEGWATEYLTELTRQAGLSEHLVSLLGDQCRNELGQLNASNR